MDLAIASGSFTIGFRNIAMTGSLSIRTDLPLLVCMRCPLTAGMTGGTARQVDRRVAAFREESGSGVPVQVVQGVRGP